MPNGDAAIYCHRFCAKCFIIIVKPHRTSVVGSLSKFCKLKVREVKQHWGAYKGCFLKYKMV